MASASTPQIVRCLRHDLDGDLLAGARYAERIAAAAALNPWADPEMAGNYAAAAQILRNEHEQHEDIVAGFTSTDFGSLRC
jgi:hypothetical protein